MTKNLFHDISTPEELEALFRLHPSRPLLPPYSSEEWVRVRQNPLIAKLMSPVRERALQELSSMPELTDELYAEFRQTGRRIGFESVYFERRRHLGRAVLSILTGPPDDPERDKLIASAIAKFTSIVDDVSWALPAHVNWHNNDLSGKDPFEIDLLCAETANQMGEILDLLGDLVPVALQKRLRARLQSQIFENYLNNPERHHWTRATHNWNAVCHYGVLGAALSQLHDPAQLAQMLWRARTSLPLFLSGFTKDGGCSEGVGYWNYGFGWFAYSNEQLETRTGGALSFFEGDEHIRKIARFAPAMALAGGVMVNFSDNLVDGKLNPAILAYLGERLHEPACQREADNCYRRYIEAGINLDAERSDAQLARLFLRCPEEVPGADSSLAVDTYLPDLAVLVAHGRDTRGHAWDFAAKAGHNDEHHNHNDCGSFILSIDGVCLLSEIGAPEYVKDFFGPKRYEFLAARSKGHSLPVINGIEQAPGREFDSLVLLHELSPEKAEFVIDGTAAYPPEAACRQWVRNFAFDKSAGRLRVRDSFDLSRVESLETALVSFYPVILSDGHARICEQGLELAIRALPGTKIERVETLPYQTRFRGESNIYRIVLVPETLAALVVLEVEMELRENA